MRLRYILCLLVLAACGCARFGGDGAANKAANANASAKPVAKALDMPSLIGKSHDEMNKMLGQDVKAQSGSAVYKLPKGTLFVVDSSKEKTASMLSYKLDTVDLGEGMSSSGVGTAEELGRMVGLEVKGTPSKSEYEDKYYDFDLNGKKCELTAGKLLGNYNEIKLYCP